MDPFHYTLWSPANGVCGNPDNVQHGIFLGLDSSLQECASQLRHAEAIGVQNQDLAPARSTWCTMSVIAQEIGTDTTITGYLSRRFPRRLEKKVSSAV
jgi:hypothetical protein